MVYIKRYLLFIGLVLLIYSCTKRSELLPLNKPTILDRSGSFSVEYTDQSIRTYINSLKSKGYITIATSIENDKSGEIKDFNYNLAKSFAESLRIRLNVVDVKKFSDFFTKTGYSIDNVMHDNTIQYTPDLLDQVDFYAYNITINEWRKRLVTFIPVYPVKIFVVTSKREAITSLEELNGKKLVTTKGSIYEELARALESDNAISFSYIYSTGGSGNFDSIRKNDAFFALRDGDVTLRDIKNYYPDITIAFPVGKMSTNGWCVSRDNIHLQTISNMQEIVELLMSYGI